MMSTSLLITLVLAVTGLSSYGGKVTSSLPNTKIPNNTLTRMRDIASPTQDISMKTVTLVSLANVTKPVTVTRTSTGQHTTDFTSTVVLTATTVVATTLATTITPFYTATIPHTVTETVISVIPTVTVDLDRGMGGYVNE